MMTRNQENRRRGAAVALTVVMIPVMFGFAALSIDLGIRHNVRTELQIAADSAALAGAQDLVPQVSQGGFGPATIAARHSAAEYIDRNPVFSDRPVVYDTNTDIEIGRADWNKAKKAWSFVSGVLPPNAVHVTVHYGLDYIFAPMLGVTRTEVGAEAIAVVPPPVRAGVVPIPLRVPGFGPVDPDIVQKNPGKDGPSSPADGQKFQIGEEVTLFIFGKGKQSPVHLVLDIGGMFPSASVDNILGGRDDPVPMSIGDELPVVGGGTGQGGLGGSLANRLNDGDPANDSFIVPIVETLPDSRSLQGRLVNPVRVVDFAAVTLTEIRAVVVPKPDDPTSTMTIEILVGRIIQASGAGSGNGSGTTAGEFTDQSVVASLQLIK